MGAERIFEMDADLSHDASYLPHFLRLIDQGADLVLGSRYVKGGGVENWGLSRKVISRGGCLYAQTILGLPLQRPHRRLQVLPPPVLETIDLDAVDTKGYGFQIEMTYRAYKLGFKVVELPIIFVDRKVGESKMSNDIVVEAMKNVWKLRFSHVPTRRRAEAAAGRRRGLPDRRDLAQPQPGRRPRRRRRRRHQRHPPHASRASRSRTRSSSSCPRRRRSPERRIAAATARGQTVVFRGPRRWAAAPSTLAMKAHLAAGHAFVATESAAASFADDLGQGARAGRARGGRGRRGRSAAAPAGGRRRRGRLRRPGRGGAHAGPAPARRGAGVRRRGRRRAGPRLRAGQLQPRAPLLALGAGGDRAPAHRRPLLRRRTPYRRRSRAWPRRPAPRRPWPATRRRSSRTPARPRSTAPCRPASHDAVLVNVGNGHTVCLLALEGRVAGVFEHHTSCLDGPGLELRLRRWLAGDLDERGGPRRPRPRRRARARRRRRRLLASRSS